MWKSYARSRDFVLRVARDLEERGIQLREETERLEADGLGGFASGTVAGGRTRRYHALLPAAIPTPSIARIPDSGSRRNCATGGSYGVPTPAFRGS